MAWSKLSLLHTNGGAMETQWHQECRSGQLAELLLLQIRQQGRPCRVMQGNIYAPILHLDGRQGRQIFETETVKKPSGLAATYGTELLLAPPPPPPSFPSPLPLLTSRNHLNLQSLQRNKT